MHIKCFIYTQVLYKPIDDRKSCGGSMKSDNSIRKCHHSNNVFRSPLCTKKKKSDPETIKHISSIDNMQYPNNFYTAENQVTQLEWMDLRILWSDSTVCVFHEICFFYIHLWFTKLWHIAWRMTWTMLWKEICRE
jgi:hypothetical protein